MADDEFHHGEQEDCCQHGAESAEGGQSHGDAGGYDPSERGQAPPVLDGRTLHSAHTRPPHASTPPKSAHNVVV